MTNKVIPLSIPTLNGNEWKYVKECLDSGWISSAGPFVERFEKAIASKVKASYAVAVVNGTAALHIALLSCGVARDEEVLVSNLTFAAPVNTILYCGAYPILMDADPLTWQMDVKKLRQFLEEECELRGNSCFNKKTKRKVRAILAVHILGLMCDIETILDLAKRFHLKVIEDAAQAMGLLLNGRHAGTFGDVGALSFNGNKVMTSGGGGMVVTHDKRVAEYARYLSTQAKDDAMEYIHKEIGFNYRLTNLHAAIGLAQLEQLDRFISKKREIAAFYKKALKDVEGIVLMPSPKDYEPTYWLYTFLLNSKATLDQRKAVIAALRKRGVEARPLWHTLHDLPPYSKAGSYRIEHSIHLYERGISLPSSVHLNTDDLNDVVKAFYEVHLFCRRSHSL